MVPRDPKDTAASVRQRLLNASRATEFLCPALGAARFSGEEFDQLWQPGGLWVRPFD